MITQTNTPLAPFTSLNAGGTAESLLICETTEELISALGQHGSGTVWLLGYGCNSLISDKGLSGTVLVLQGGNIVRQGNTLVADAGVWWDDLVQYTSSEGLWGLELMSAIPGSVGAAVRGNIAAYGQAVADTLEWVDILDRATGLTTRTPASTFAFSYRYCSLQDAANAHKVVLRAAFALQPTVTHQLTYRAALDAAVKQNLSTDTLENRRKIILSVREAAASLWDYRDAVHPQHTAGSFFRNPLVAPETAQTIMAYDETGRSAELLRQMNATHGGEALRVSAAHVLLAAGFTRGQTWGNVRLNPQHILKLENTGTATAQEIYNVAQMIVRTVKQNLGVDLQPEVVFLGEFDTPST